MGESYWQQGCNDGKAGLPLNPEKKYLPGYEAGWKSATGQPLYHSGGVFYDNADERGECACCGRPY